MLDSRAHGLQINSAKGDTLVTLVIVDSKVGKARVAAAKNLAVYESRGKRAVAVLASDVVRTEFGGLDILDQEPETRISAHNAGTEDGTVLVVVPRKQVPHDSLVVPRRHKMSHLVGVIGAVPRSGGPSRIGDGGLRLVLHPAVAPGNLNRRTFKESSPWRNWRFKGDTVCATDSVRNEYGIDAA